MKRKIKSSELNTSDYRNNPYFCLDSDVTTYKYGAYE